MDSPRANLEETREFLDHLPAAGSEHLAVIQEGRGLVARTFARGSTSDAIDWLAKFQGVANCYYHPNPLRDGVADRKAKRDDVASGRMLHVDIDDLEAVGRIAAFPIRPTVVIMSGGGYQCFWFLRDPVDDLVRVEAANRRIAERLGGDSCHSADHLMRLPGTLNVPNEKKRRAGRSVALAVIVRDMTDFGRLYAIEELERELGGGGGIVPVVGGHSVATQIPLLDADKLGVSISEFTADLIRHGDNREHPVGTVTAAYPSRSEVVFRVACDLVKAGADEDAIIGVLINPANGISASILERPDPTAYAARQARQAIRATGEGWPDLGKGGRPLATFANVLIALARLGLRFEYDAFSNRRRVEGRQLQELTGELSDDVCAAIRLEVLRRWKFDPGKEHVRDAAHTLSVENTVHPVRAYLDGLRWDGQSRLATWLARYLGAEATAFHQTVGELVLIAAVRRVRAPGAKFDSILVLEGRQGSGKSTAINILATDAWFSDQEILTLDPKAQMEALEGVWLYELGELQGLNKAETERVKAFASRLVDRGRPAYARFRESRPRQTIFIGTTNDDQYLRDPTGNRRFWPVKSGQIDLEALRRDRDQLWAEATMMEAEGRPLTLPEELWPVAAEAQESRLMDDPWLEALRSLRGSMEGGFERVTTHKALAHLEMTAERQNPSFAKRLGPLMRKLGWDGPKQLRMKVGVLRGYERAEDPDDPPAPTY